MTLYEKITTLYPDLLGEDLLRAGIVLLNNSDGRGDYIASWEHPEYPEPTQEQLDAITE